MYRKNFSLYPAVLALLLIMESSHAQICISEVMFNAASGNNEFVELYNCSSMSPADLKGYKIKYQNAAPDNLVQPDNDYLLRPLSYAIVLEGDYDSVNSIYRFPPGTLILHIDDNAFGTSGMSNTSGRTVYLLNGSSDTADAYAYSADNPAGFSDEIILPCGGSSQDNWSNSLLLNGTPGFRNSVSPKSRDICVSDLSFIPLFPTVNLDFTVSAVIRNTGTESADTVSASMFVKYERDTGYTLIKKFDAAHLNAGDSVMFEAVYNVRLSGSYTFLVKATISSDEFLPNDTLSSAVQVSQAGTEYNGLIISEIMYAPPSGEAEWLEIFNRTSRTIDIRDWHFKDNSARVKISQKEFNVAPGEYIILSKDSSICSHYGTAGRTAVFALPALNNSGDILSLYSPSGRCIDSLEYMPEWGGNTGGRSLERISTEAASAHAASWTTSPAPAGATPGIRNAASEMEKYSVNDLVINEIMYDPMPEDCEFIELLNISAHTVKTCGLRISSGSTDCFIYFSAEIPPGGYCILAADSSLFSPGAQSANSSSQLIVISGWQALSNQAGSIAIRDFYNTTIDSVYYQESWHNGIYDITRGRSLERISPYSSSCSSGSWSSSVSQSGATPGGANSIFTAYSPVSSELSVDPNPFSPDNDGHEDFTFISYSVLGGAARIRIRIFDSRGRQVKTVINNDITGPTGKIIYDGKNDDGDYLRTGIYILLLEATGEWGQALQTVKKAFVVARGL